MRGRRRCSVELKVVLKGISVTDGDIRWNDRWGLMTQMKKKIT